eukprot:scaffold1090_cov135-Isochrysis_galbana.AAC.4
MEYVLHGVAMAGVQTTVQAPPPCVAGGQSCVFAKLNHVSHLRRSLALDVRHAGAPVAVRQELEPLQRYAEGTVGHASDLEFNSVSTQTTRHVPLPTAFRSPHPSVAPDLPSQCTRKR